MRSQIIKKIINDPEWPKRMPSGASLGWRQWFTLVELIVVVTILAVLATIGFVSYSSYLTWVRDTNRLAQLVSISDWLELYSTKNDLPLPDESVEVKVNWNLIAYQWKAWTNVLETIDFSKWWVDPKDWEPFSYYLTRDRKYFQLMAFLEEWVENLASTWNTWNDTLWILDETYAINYQDRIPTVAWRKLGILTTDENNTPIEETTGTWVNITSSTNNLKSFISESEVLTWTWVIAIIPNYSCKRLRETSWARSNWIYKLSQDWWTTEYNMNCAMSDLKENLVTERWSVWTWDDWNFIARSRESESSRANKQIPFWGEDIVWIAKSDGDTSHTNDWWFEYQLNVPLDTSKTYRFSVWYKKVWTKIWRIYFWTQYSWTTHIVKTIWGTAQWNPYFENDLLSNQDNINTWEWYLLVWYIHPDPYTWSNKRWWIYGIRWNKKNSNVADYIHDNPTDLNGEIRVFQHSDVTPTNEVYFYDPRIEIIDPSQVWDVSDLIP